MDREPIAPPASPNSVTRTHGDPWLSVGRFGLTAAQAHHDAFLRTILFAACSGIDCSHSNGPVSHPSLRSRPWQAHPTNCSASHSLAASKMVLGFDDPQQSDHGCPWTAWPCTSRLHAHGVLALTPGVPGARFRFARSDESWTRTSHAATSVTRSTAELPHHHRSTLRPSTVSSGIRSGALEGQINCSNTAAAEV